MSIKRCSWVPENNIKYQKYHDEEWGIPIHDDIKLFEMLILEGAQAGLSWETVLRKREGYRRAFKNFDIKAVACMKDDELESLMHNPEIIRNRLKIYSTRKNAAVFLSIQEEFSNFSNYIWGFVDNKPVINGWDIISQIPTSTDISDKISKDLKKRGMSFVGSTITYSYMQAVGLVNDHMKDCWKFNLLR